ncbi:hypothetical protein [Nocardia nova]|uniref:hypothetical protein n=1 Tax=Nocardia nova TaxID=37330 RepID=UPI0011B0E8E8|nr:hypothetical protein [Nocardia nova]
MGENAPRVRRTGGSRRSPAVAQQLKARQERRNALRAAERERRKRIDEAERSYTAAFKAIDRVKQDTAGKVKALEKQIDAAREREKMFIAEQQRKQALAAVAIRAEVSGVDDVAEELQISAAETRQLLKMARPVSKDGAAPPPPSRAAAAEKSDTQRTPHSRPASDAVGSAPVSRPAAPLPGTATGASLAGRSAVFGSGANTPVRQGG